MPEGTTRMRTLLAMTRLLRASRSAATATDELAAKMRQLRAYRRHLQTSYSRSRHKDLVKQRNRAANRVARRSRRINRLRAR